MWLTHLHKNLLATAFIFLLAGCGDVDNSIPPAELTDFEPNIELKVNWSQSLGGGSDLYHKLSAAVVDDAIYTVSAQGLVSKVALKTGQVIWQTATQSKMYAGLAATSDYLVIASSEGQLSVYKNDVSLPIVWQTHVKSEVNVQPVIEGDYLFVRLSNGQLIAYELATGKKNWVVSQRVPELSLTGSSLPVIKNNAVYSGFDNGSLVAIELSSGETAWEKSISTPSGRSELDRMIDLDGTFAVENSVIYTSTFQGRLAAIQTIDGSELWSRPMSSIKNINVDGSAVYVTDEQSNLWSIDRRTGAALWKQEALHHRKLTSMALMGDKVVVADFEGYAHWLDKLSGELSGRLSLFDTNVLVDPIVLQDNNERIVLFLDTSNDLISVSVEDI